MRLIAATQNAHKLGEMRVITEKSDMELVSMAEVGLADLDIVEDGSSFEENSEIKARTICDITGEPAIADDSGLCVNYLDGAPGIYSARYAGEEHDDAANRRKLFEALEGVPAEERKAAFVCVITLVYPDGRKLVARGEVWGRIAFEERGANGFGYDNMFIPDEQCGPERTFAEFAPEEKNAISHRSRALAKLCELLENER